MKKFKEILTPFIFLAIIILIITFIITTASKKANSITTNSITNNVIKSLLICFLLMNFKIIKYSKIIVNLINVCLPKIILLEYMTYILKIANKVININIKCFNLMFLFFIRKYNIYTLNGTNNNLKK